MGKVIAGEQVTIVFSLNGESVSGMAQPRLLLSDYLRGQLGVTGSHVGCEHGVCGACTVKIDAEQCVLALHSRFRRMASA